MTQSQVKKLAIFAGVIILIAIALTIIYLLQSNTADKVILTESVESSVTKIKLDIDNSGNNFELIKENNEWKVDNVKADQNKISELFKLLNETKISTIASTNPDNYSLFNVDDKSGIVIGFFQNNNKFLTLVIGKTGTNGNYLRIEGDSNVYLVNKNIRDVVSGTVNDFKDKTLSEGTIGDLTKIIAKDFQINNSSNGFTLENHSDSLDQVKTQSFVNNLINFKAYEIATLEESKTIEGRSPTLSYQIEFSNGNSFAFDIYKIDEESYLVKRKDNTILKIFKSQFDNINVNRESLLINRD